MSITLFTRDLLVLNRPILIHFDYYNCIRKGTTIQYEMDLLINLLNSSVPGWRYEEYPLYNILERNLLGNDFGKKYNIKDSNKTFESKKKSGTDIIWVIDINENILEDIYKKCNFNSLITTLKRSRFYTIIYEYAKPGTSMKHIILEINTKTESYEIKYSSI